MKEKYGDDNKIILIMKEQQIDIKNMLVNVCNKIKKFSIILKVKKLELFSKIQLFQNHTSLVFVL